MLPNCRSIRCEISCAASRFIVCAHEFSLAERNFREKSPFVQANYRSIRREISCELSSELSSKNHGNKERNSRISLALLLHNTVDLLNTVQRHTCCSSNYCLRKKENEPDLKCRFHFPFQHSMSTKLEFEPINSKTTISQYKVKVITERNDPRLNNHQRLQLQGWRANCDIQVVIDYHACVEYLTNMLQKESHAPLF